MRNLRIIALIAVLALALVACGDTAFETATADPTQTASTGSTVVTASTQTAAGAISVETGSTGAPDAYAGTVAAMAAVSYVVVDTGQTACYSETGAAVACPASGDSLFGQDGDYSTTAPAYVDNGDGTVSDLNTGLMWQQDPGDKMTYDEAMAAVGAFDLAGYGDWRLPTIKELFSLIDFSGTDPSNCRTLEGCDAIPFIDTGYFTFEYGDTSAGERVIDSQYVSSTLYVSTTMGGDATAFGVNFADGRIKGYGLTNPRGGEKEFFVMFVRGNPDYGDNEFVDNGDGTVSDLATGLVWQQADDGVSREWQESLEYCEVLDLGGSDDWRLPDVKELQSIVDYTRSPATSGTAAIDPVFGTSTIVDEGGSINWPFFWSSTTHASQVSGDSADYIAFGEALGWMEDPQDGYQLMDVHGAGAQRSDPKTGDADQYPYGHGPQGDVVRIENAVRCVSGGDAEVVSGGAVTVAGDPGTDLPADAVASGPLAGAAATLGVTEDALVAAMGDPADGPPDFDAAAFSLGVSLEDLMAALGPPPGR